MKKDQLKASEGCDSIKTKMERQNSYRRGEGEAELEVNKNSEGRLQTEQSQMGKANGEETHTDATVRSQTPHEENTKPLTTGPEKTKEKGHQEPGKMIGS